MYTIWLLLCTLTLLLLLLLSPPPSDASGMIEVFKWQQMDFYNRGGSRYVSKPQRPTYGGNSGGGFVFPGRSTRHTAYDGYSNRQKRDFVTSRDQPVLTQSRFNLDDSDNATYIPYNNVPMGATHHNGRLFVTMPRRRLGIPSTLNYIDMRKDGKQQSPKLHAYPNYDINQFNATRMGIVSVYRTTVDACQRLWFIDTGLLELPGNRQQLKRPSIWIVDLKNDRTIRRFEIPESIVSTGSGLASISVDVQPQNCNQAFAYIPDLVNRQLYVYSFEPERIWAFSHNYFNFDPVAGDLNIGGQTFRWDDGIFSTTLGPLKADGSRDVYFHAMASNNEFVVSNRVLQQEANAARSDHSRDFRLLGSRGENKQSTMHAYDPRTGVIFYDEIQRNGVGCWNTKRDFSAAQHGTVEEDAERMIYPSDLTIDEEGTIWVMSNSMPIFIYSQLDTSVYNFRIWKQSSQEAKRNTVCE